MITKVKLCDATGAVIARGQYQHSEGESPYLTIMLRDDNEQAGLHVVIEQEFSVKQ